MRARHRLSKYLEHEGSIVSVALADGSRIDDCDLVSVGRGSAGTLWVFTQGHDVFVALDDVIDVWPTTRMSRSRAA
jgi:hypothetical protein